VTQADCAHEQSLWLDSHVDVFTRADNSQRWISIRVRVKCAACDALFSWRGLNSGLANPDEPVVSADGFELRAPIAPGPGGTLGVLQLAGVDLAPPPQEDDS
jgi:hypothetical protein